jgi:dTDP-4-dehydrorhamnose 3,5-epimerase
MAWIETNIAGVWIFEPKIWKDHRGYFVETFNASGLPNELRQVKFVQDNEAGSVRGVLRGLHYQLPPFAQAKLVRVVSGEVLDVIVDIRVHSSTFGQSLSVVLNDINKKQLYIPKGFAHGYIVLSDTATFAYKCDEYYHPECDAGIRYDDPELNIDWLLPFSEFQVSEKDSLLPNFKQHLPFQ